MSGHSRWSQIKHKKEIEDLKRGQLFSKLAKKISIAARSGSDPAINFKLQSAIEEAHSFNLPKENIERAIKRASDKTTAALDQIVIQAIGPGAVAIVIEAITDNRNRTISEVKNILVNGGAKMVPEGSLNWMFSKNWTPLTPVELNDPIVRQKLERLFEELDDHADVEEVYTNLKM